MDAQTHWEKIYTEKAPEAVSWYRPHLETSLALIEQAAAGSSASVIDVGGGESTLVDDLLARGYESITVLDISQTAIDANRKRLGKTSERVHWLVADITQVELKLSAYHVWHDRAVFHFLASPSDRLAYVRQVTRAVKPGGKCDRQHFRARRANQVQRSGGRSLRTGVVAPGVWRTFSPTG